MLFLLCFLLLASVCHGARVTLLSGTSINGQIATNSVLADISLEDGLAVSCSQTDSQISLAPFDDDWAAIDEGTLFGDLTVVSGASNIVSVHPSNWQSISLLLAGPEAKILGLRLKWRPDGTQLILR